MRQIDLGDDALALEPDGPDEWIEALVPKVFAIQKVSSEAADLYREYADTTKAKYDPPKLTE